MAKRMDFKQGAYKEAVDYFKQKINLPTRRWNDLEGAMHTRAFTVAGAMRADILLDFRKAVDKAIEKGDSLQDFRNNFYDIAKKWRAADPSFDAKMEKPKYGAWRSKVIYQTNMVTAAAAAQERQARAMPDVFTHAKYICQMLPGSRDEHKAWNGTVLPVNDPWWEKHSPPNGFGCLCEKEFISKYEMDAGMEKQTKAPTAPNDTTNIGEKWDYSIGDADAENQRLNDQLNEKLKKVSDLYGNINENDTVLSPKVKKIADKRREKRTPSIIQGIRDRWNDRKDERAGNIPKVKTDKKIDSFKKPAELFEYMENKRGFKIDERLKKFDLGHVKEVLKGIDSVMTVFPEAKIDILGTDPKDKNRAITRHYKIPNTPFSILINKKYFGKNSVPYTDDGFHPKNGCHRATAYHEMGHVVQCTLAQMEMYKYDNFELVAKQIVNKAAQDSGVEISDYNKVLKFRAGISRYADEKYSCKETVAEAVSDVFNNRSNAAAESKAVYKALMERINNVRKNKRNN